MPALSPPAPRVLVALGSNLGDSRSILEAAMDQLERLSAGPARRSSIWRSTPVDCPPGSGLFLNAAISLKPRLTDRAESWLRELQNVEAAMGRQRKAVLNEPRILDLDLIAWGQEVRNTPELILPHPRAHLRRFVLAPLAEIAPEFLLPGQRKTVAELLEDLHTDEDVRRTEEKPPC